MSVKVRLHYATNINSGERDFLERSLLDHLNAENRILEDHLPFKQFHCISTPHGKRFVKSRVFKPLLRRIGRTIRSTKEEMEFRNYLLLQSCGIPTPPPVAAGKIKAKFLATGSLLIMTWLEQAVSLRDALMDAAPSPDPLLDRLFEFLMLMKRTGIVHEDLKWDNILVEPLGPQSRLYLIDALHIHREGQNWKDAFSRSIVRFHRCLIEEDAPPSVIDGFRARMAQSTFDVNLG